MRTTRKSGNLILVTLTFSLEVLCHTVENIYVLSGNIYMIEEVVVHKVPVALVVLSGQSNVFIHIEGNNVLKGNLTCLVHLDKSFVNTERRRGIHLGRGVRQLYRQDDSL